MGATGNHRRHPLPRTVLSASVRIMYRLPAFWLQAGSSGIDSVCGSRTRDSNRQHSDPNLQANEPRQLPAKTVFKFSIILDPSRAGGAPKRTLYISNNYSGQSSLTVPCLGSRLVRPVQSPLYRKSIHTCINLFTTTRIRNAEHFRKVCGTATPEVMHSPPQKQLGLLQ